MEITKFNDLSLQEQKMRIVQDAIEQITLGVIVPTTGDYMTMYKDAGIEEVNIKLLLEKKLAKCECCVKGALFMSCVFNVNEVTTQEKYSNGALAYREEPFMKQKLSKWFSPLELNMIETAFEGDVIRDETNELHDDGEFNDLAYTCMSFCNDIEDPADDSEKMLMILNNILQYGEFKP